MRVAQIAPEELGRRLGTDEADLVVLDVREPEELQVARLDGAHHVPMGDVPVRLADLDRDKRYVVICHHGVRSATVCAFLLQRGFLHVENLRGGIDAYARDVDPTIPRY